LKICSLPTFSMKSPNKIFVWHFGNERIHDLIPHKTILRIITFILSWDMGIQNNDLFIMHLFIYLFLLITLNTFTERRMGKLL